MSDLVAIAALLTPFAVSGARLLEKLLGRPCEVAGDMMADQIYAWQWTNRTRIAHKAVEIMERDEIAVRVLPTGFLLPLLENAGNVDDDELQELWANLLASAVEEESACQSSYIQILQGLSRAEARLLQRTADTLPVLSYVEFVEDNLVVNDRVPKKLLVELGFSDSESFWASSTRLEHLGLVILEPVRRDEVRKTEDNWGPFYIVKNQAVGRSTTIQIKLTRFGAALLQKATRLTIDSSSVLDSLSLLNRPRHVPLGILDDRRAVPLDE